MQIAASMIHGAAQRITITAGNVSNMNTPGFLPWRTFSAELAARGGLPLVQVALARPSATAALRETGAEFDLAAGPGVRLGLRGPDGLIFRQSAQLQRDSDGRLIDAAGLALQTQDGDDLVLPPGPAIVTPAGVVLIDGLPQGQIGVFDASGAALDQADPALPVAVRQGMIVPANINLGDEMIELGKASRQAETGARLFQIQDDVLSQVASKLGTIAR